MTEATKYLTYKNSTKNKTWYGILTHKKSKRKNTNGKPWFSLSQEISNYLATCEESRDAPIQGSLRNKEQTMVWCTV